MPTPPCLKKSFSFIVRFARSRRCFLSLGGCSAVFVCGLAASAFLFSVSQSQAQSNALIPTTVEIRLMCGDGYAETLSGEVCDPGQPPDILPDVGSTTCSQYDDIFGNPYVSGQVGCNSECTDFTVNACFTCGNSYKESAEECDSQDFGGITCVTLGYQSGTLQCSHDCRISASDCVAMQQHGGIPGQGSGGGSAGGVTGFLPGSLSEQETKVVMRGKSYPNADVHILADGKVTGIVKTDAKADFYFESNEIPAGVASFGFWSEDKDGLKSTLLSLTLRVISRAVTTISGVYIAPTIDVDKKSVRQGEEITIYGQTVPGTEVHVHINSEQEFIEQTNSTEDGGWKLPFDTMPLEEDFHTAKALFQVAVEGNVIKSGFSKAISFHVGQVGGEAVCPEADLNGDGRVNLTDFSILLFYWGTDNPCADQNQNGIVDLIDFSIMMYYWTG